MTTCEIKLFWIKVTTFNKSKLAQKDELCTFECSLNGEDKELEGWATCLPTLQVTYLRWF